MRTAAVFDIDGTLADDRHRRHLIDWTQADPDKRYERYHEAVRVDELINSELVNKHHLREDIIWFLTARPQFCHPHTVDWLKNNFPYLPSINIMMRNNEDHRHSPELKLDMLRDLQDRLYDIVAIYDDREDTLIELERHGFHVTLITTCGKPPTEANGRALSPAEILREMAKTFDERSTTYGHNLQMVQPIMEILFPDGVPKFSTKMHLFELLIMKLTRFAVSNLTHIDSIHDAGPYCAMLESEIKKEEQ